MLKEFQAFLLPVLYKLIFFLSWIRLAWKYLPVNSLFFHYKFISCFRYLIKYFSNAVMLKEPWVKEITVNWEKTDEFGEIIGVNSYRWAEQKLELD